MRAGWEGVWVELITARKKEVFAFVIFFQGCRSFQFSMIFSPGPAITVFIIIVIFVIIVTIIVSFS